MTSLDRRFYVRSVARVMQNTSLASDVLVELVNRSSIDVGQAQRQAVKNLELILGSGDFDWPWFVQWHDTFKASRKWPDTVSWSWFSATEFTPRMTAKLPAKQANAKRELLVSSLQSCAFNLQRLEQICELTGLVRGRAISLDFSASCNRARTHSKAWHANGDATTMPPFFPGDSTSLRALNKTSKKEK